MQNKTIAHAANQLYISQGTASTRLQNLEEELGIRLFFRQKGIKTATLTPEGEYFLTIAQQCLSLKQQAGQLKNIPIFQELRVAAIDILNQFYFMEVYQKFIMENPDIRLCLRTEHSFEMYPLIENQQIDIGFAFTLHKSPNVIATALYREEMVILYEKDHVFSQTHRLDDLKPEYEIYQTFGNSYDMWHQRRFPHARTRIVSIASMSMLPPGIYTSSRSMDDPASLYGRYYGAE